MAAQLGPPWRRRGTFVWPNGDCYSGDWLDGARTGEGALTYANGDRYEGGFLDGRYHGRGVLRRAPCSQHGALHRGQTYSGEWAHGKRHGRGVLVVGDGGTTYDGEFARDCYHGRGVARYADGGTSRVYDGGWRRGRWHGQGQLALASGDTYDGAFHDGAFHGEGLYRHAGGGSYAGAFVRGLRHGIGRRLWASGAEYEGEWAAGAMHGRGIYRSPGGDVAVGGFRHGAPHGQCTLLYANGCRYQGTLVRGAFCGAGRFTHADGSYYEGEYLALLRTGVPAADDAATASQRELRRQAGAALYAARPGRHDGSRGRPAAVSPAPAAVAPSGSLLPPPRRGRSGRQLRLAAPPGARADDQRATRRGRAASAPYSVPARLRPPAPVTGRVVVGSDADARLQASLRGEPSAPAGAAPPRLAADGRRHGRGVRVWASGARYDGEFFQGLQHGFGVYVGAPMGPASRGGAAQQRYEGSWRAGRRCGYGVASYGRDGDDGRDSGGVFVCPLGHQHRGSEGRCVYDGEWLGDAFHGAGTLTCCDGRQHRGAWRRGLPHGPGRRVALPRRLWVPLPDFADPLAAPARRPVALLTAALRPPCAAAPRVPLDALSRIRVSDGTWAGGVQTGPGRALLNRGDVVEGEWSADGRLCGRAVLTFVSGRVVRVLDARALS